MNTPRNRWLALLAVVACACHVPPPDKTLEVRHLNAKCALVKFSSCPTQPAAEPDEADAGTD